MRFSILLSALCGTSALGLSLRGHGHHLHRELKRQDTYESTTTEGNTVIVYDYTVVDERVTPGQPLPTATPAKGNEKIALISAHSSSTSPVAAAPVHEKVAPLGGNNKQPSPQPAPETSAASPGPSAAPIASGQTNGVVAAISSITEPTASVLSANAIIGTVCTASVPQLPTAFADVAIAAHNVHRANHSAPNVIWNNELATYAASWASYCNFSHNNHFGGGGYGQNIAAGIAINDIASVISDMWYNSEISAFEGSYGQAYPSTNLETWGHFTQVVWSNTKLVGCATIDCGACGVWMNSSSSYASNMGKYMTVCNYRSAGNMAGEYADNVNKPLGKAIVTGTAFST